MMMNQKEQEPEIINSLLVGVANLVQGSFGIVADSSTVTGQAKTTICTEVGATGHTVGSLVAESKVNDEQIDVTLKAGPSQLGAGKVNVSQIGTARRPTNGKKDSSETNSAVGVNAGSIMAETLNNNVVQNAYHLMEASNIVKTFWTAEAPTHAFVGRDEQLELIHKKLQENGATQENHVRRIVALVSTPGMGKTAIARAFVQKYKDQYENVAWIDATKDSTARPCFINLARLLKVDHSYDDKGKDLARLVYAHISNHFENPPLLIFDNAQQLETDENFFGIYDYLPTQVKRNLPFILVTSRSDEWRHYNCEIVEVPCLSKEESFQFFWAVFRLSEKEKEDSKLNGLLQHLADKLGRHPGRLKKAEKFISSSRFSAGQNTLSRLKETARKCIKKVDGTEFSAEILDAEVEELSAQSGPVSNSAGLPSSNDTYNAMAMAEQCSAVITRKCVEVFGRKMELSLSSLPFVDELKFSEIQNAAEDEAILLFTEESRKMGDVHAAQDELMITLAEKASLFRARNQMQQMLTSNDAEMDAKVADVYDQDAVQIIQNELAVDACKKMQDWLGALQKQLQCQDRWSEQIKANCERLKNETSTFIFETEADYKNALDPSKFHSEGEMAKVEFESRSKAMKALQKFSRNVSETKMSSLRADLIARLDDTNEKVREEVKNNEEILKEQLHFTIKEAAAEYKKSMVGLLLSQSGAIAMEEKSSLPSTTNKVEEVFTIEQMPPIASEDLEKFHRKSEVKASKILSKFLEKNNKKFKSPIQKAEKSREKLGELISETFSHFQKLAHKKMESVKAQAFKEMAKAEHEFTKEMKKLIMRAEDEKRFDLEASLCKAQAKSWLAASIDVSLAHKKIFQDTLSELDTKVEQLLVDYKVLMRKQYQEKMENLKARNNIVKVEEEFRAEMEKLLAKSIQTFDLKASNLQNRLTTKFQNSMDVSVMGTQSVQEIMSSWDHRVQELLRLYKVAIWNPIQERLESAKSQDFRDLAKVKEEFGAEMEPKAAEATGNATQAVEKTVEYEQ